MKKITILFTSICLCFIANISSAQSDSIIMKDVQWDKDAPAGAAELFIPSGNSLMAAYMYKPNGAKKHPTLILLHGYPGNEKNLDLAQIVRAHGWNVIYFDYRGSWGSEGQFSFTNCVEDAVNVVAFCKKYSDSLHIDTSNIVLFGHSMGAWVCLKALAELPGIKKGFALSTWNIYADVKNVPADQLKTIVNDPKYGLKTFVLNTPVEEIFEPVIKNLSYYNIANDSLALAGKQIIMLDEHNRNAALASTLKNNNHNYFDYNVWQTDHPFTNKRISLINKVLAFLEK